MRIRHTHMRMFIHCLKMKENIHENFNSNKIFIFLKILTLLCIFYQKAYLQVKSKL